MTRVIHRMKRLQKRMHQTWRELGGQDAATNNAKQAAAASTMNQTASYHMPGQAVINKALNGRLNQTEEVSMATAAGYQQDSANIPAIDYDRIAASAAQRPVVVYVDKKAAAVLMTREMDTAIGNRNIQQLVSMGG